MKQKLALARTLLHRPKLVLLDEPTSGLDVQAAVSIRDDLQTLITEEEVTIFLTTHNMTDADKLCHQVGIIREGKLLALGTPDELKSKIGSTHVEVSGKGFNTEALKKLRAYPQISEIHTKNNHLVIDLKNGAATSSIVNFLVGAGIQVEEVRRQDASLEDVYLSIIGEKDV
jgi:ABC-2 type transport system ATP-binding protein